MYQLILHKLQAACCTERAAGGMRVARGSKVELVCVRVCVCVCLCVCVCEKGGGEGGGGRVSTLSSLWDENTQSEAPHPALSLFLSLCATARPTAASVRRPCTLSAAAPPPPPHHRVLCRSVSHKIFSSVAGLSLLLSMFFR